MMMRKFLLSLGALGAVALLSAPAKAVVLAYEGFDGGSTDVALVGTAATGTGFTGNWNATNGTGQASMYEAAGLAYPASYPGSHVAIGGNGRATGTTAGNAFVALGFDAAADTAINSAPEVYISWLGEIRNVPSTIHAPQNDASIRSTFNLAAEYVRNAGVRLMSVSATSNSALGTIGNAGDQNGGGQSVYGDAELNPEVVDTWGAYNFNDTNNIFTGNGGTKDLPTDPSRATTYNPAPAHYDGIDHLVLSVNAAAGAYRLQVNPLADGTNDGEINFVHIDGNPVPFIMHAFGLEGGSQNADRSAGDIVVDEIYIADSFADAAGFTQAVPEPTSALLMVCGLLGLGLRRRS